MAYLLHISILTGIYTLLSVSLNLIVGYTGMLSVAHAAFYGVGAYVTAVMALKLQTGLWLNLFCAMLLSGLLGGLIGLPALRIRDDYLAIATFGFQVIVFSILNNWVDVTGGSQGLPGIPPPIIFGYPLNSPASFLSLTLGFCALVIGLAYRIVNSPYGRVLKAIREDEIFALSLGKHVTTYKISIFVIGAGIAAIAGCLYAYYIQFIDPTSFTVMESIFIISIVIIGGAGSLVGSVVGAAFLVIVPELLRFLGLPVAIAANIRQILYGSLLVGFMLWKPQGLLGTYSLRHDSKNEL